MRALFVGLLAVIGGAVGAGAQSAPVRITLHIPSNVEVRAYAPDSARFALEGADPIARRDTVVLKDGAALAYDRASGVIHLLVRGVKRDQTVDITSSGDRKSRWAAFVTHDVAIGARGESLQILPMLAPVIAISERDR